VVGVIYDSSSKKRKGVVVELGRKKRLVLSSTRTGVDDEGGAGARSKE